MIPSNVKLVIKPMEADVAVACAQFLGDQLAQALASSDIARFAISGGNSPRPMFRLLSVHELDWTRVHVFWVDERHVPATDAESNYRMACEELLNPAKVPEKNIHRVRTELSPEDAAKDYAATITSVCGHGPILFDVMQRGIGPDAHTASLFPGDSMLLKSASLQSQDITAAAWVEKMNQWRITLTPSSIAATRTTAIYSPGADKAKAVARILEGRENTLEFPGQIATRRGVPETWFLDSASAAQLTPGS
jgi:6-phosphogluconolactonase